MRRQNESLLTQHQFERDQQSERIEALQREAMAERQSNHEQVLQIRSELTSVRLQEADFKEKYESLKATELVKDQDCERWQALYNQARGKFLAL